MKAEEYKQQLETVRVDIKKEIFRILNEKNIIEINFQGIIHNYMDDQMNEVINGLNIEQDVVFTDTGCDNDTISFEDCSTDELLGILEIVETEDYDVIEEKAKWYCKNCTWEGSNPKVAMVGNKVNSQDKSLYEENNCPDCGSEDVEEI